MKILKSSDKVSVRRHSSIDQFNGFLSVYKKGGATPIRFDSLDGISCETVYTRPIIISYGDDLGYRFDTGECTYTSDIYLYFDKKTSELVKLPEWFGGSGEFYEKFINSNSFVNLDDASLGVHNKKTLKVGLDYIKADKLLPPVD